MTETIEVLITKPFSEAQISPIEESSSRLNITVMKARSAGDIPQDIWDQVEILYTDSVLPDEGQAPKLNWIQFHWAGVDHIVDSPFLSKPGLIATTLSGAAASKVAEYVIMMFLALGSHLPDMYIHQLRAEWPQDRWKRFRPLEIRGSTIGIVGYGSIGRQIARLCNEMGAHVLASKHNAKQPVDPGYMPEGFGDPGGDLVKRLYPAQALRSMFRECDFVVITVPLTPETRGMVSSDQIAAMKHGVYLVDISRGGVIDHSALIKALQDGRIRGVALDVFPEEPLPEGSELWKIPNVIITPHISGITPYYDDRALELFTENLKRYLTDKPLFNLIDLSKGY
ncbi:D-2-hydroxyacid dehydrogenase [Chloroflexota bacterium]